MLYASRWARLSIAVGAVCLGACSAIPTSGPSSSQVTRASGLSNPAGIQLVDVTDDVARRLFSNRSRADFSSTLADEAPYRLRLGDGDAVEISVWEAPPAMLFSGGPATFALGDNDLSSSVQSGSRVTTLPVQVIDTDGNIQVPFAGTVRAADKTSHELEVAIVAALRGKAHDPQVIVRQSRNASAYVTVVGDVASSTRMALTPRRERLLDALAAAGGVKQPIDKTTIQVTRGSKVEAQPLQAVIKDPRQNIALVPGDVVTAQFQSLSFTALGASGKSEEVNFEAQGISLAQALARAGGLNDARADAKGVFIFRFENATALQWPHQPVVTTADNRVPVVYRFDLTDPGSFFVAQNFMMDDKDLLYISNAPIAEVQKFLNVVFSVVYPVVNTVTTFK
ncbi:polysaccharide export protein [Paraburkholderia sp. 1N]|uniref:Polysaccharide export protein n=1 Tax=Paraburkholderia solitsugae TaxID=2675748 RepID=A0ABX2C531_9BURK|nr:polysaccharide biosynthesis/export family protein [Paraburkholderia solitsugae]NPT47756.1 polysaccharide export protein [Paraburkholderia solitsugae]